jgi:hypothetical protein
VVLKVRQDHLRRTALSRLLFFVWSSRRVSNNLNPTMHHHPTTMPCHHHHAIIVIVIIMRHRYRRTTPTTRKAKGSYRSSSRPLVGYWLVLPGILSTRFSSDSSDSSASSAQPPPASHGDHA